MYVSNFDLKFLGVILICAVNMHDFFQIFLQCLNLNSGRKAHGDMQRCMSPDLFPPTSPPLAATRPSPRRSRSPCSAPPSFPSGKIPHPSIHPQLEPLSRFQIQSSSLPPRPGSLLRLDRPARRHDRPAQARVARFVRRIWPPLSLPLLSISHDFSI